MDYIKSILFITIGPIFLTAIFFSKQIEVKQISRVPALEVAYTKSYDFNRVKRAFR